jgi:hypothetical protein
MRGTSMFTCKHVLGSAVAVAASLGLSSLANAATYTYTLSEATTLGAADYGTVTYTDVAGGVEVTVDLTASGDQLMGGGACNKGNGICATVAFTTNTAVTGITDINGKALGDSTGVLGNYSLVSGTFQMDGQGNYSNGILFNSNGASTTGGETVSFIVDGVTTSNFIFSTVPPGSVSSLFAIDTQTTTGATGTAGTGAVPLPGALALFGTVLAGGLGVSGWRKRRQRGPVSVMA